MTPRRGYVLAALLASGLIAGQALGQSDNAPPVFQSLTWEINHNLTGDPLLGPFEGWQPFDPDTELARETDMVRVTMQITDQDFDPNSTGGNDQVFYIVQSRWVPFDGYRSPVGPPIVGNLQQFFPSEGDGFQPAPGSTTVTIQHTFQIPTFTGVNQARLRGLIDYDVEWLVGIGISNEQSPCDLASDLRFWNVNCNSPVTIAFQTIRAIEHPGLAPPNARPIADAGPDRTVAAGQTIILDGSRTFDSFNVGFDPNSPNVFLKDQLEFTWEWISGPVRVDPVQDDVHSPKATVTLNETGTYVYRLTVDDGFNAEPTTDSVTITVVDSLPVNHAPSAIIEGPAEPVTVGSIVTLDGSQSSDPDDDPLNFLWKQTNALGQELTADEVAQQFVPLSALDEPTVQFQALQPGTFYFRLLVDDGAFLSTATFSVEVVEASGSSGQTAPGSTTNQGGDQSASSAANENGTPTPAETTGPAVPACGTGMLPAAILPVVLCFWRLRIR